MDSINYVHIVGEVRNDSASSVTFAKININLLDGVGTLVGTDFTYTEVDTLTPGESSAFEDTVIGPPAGFASYSISSVNASVATTQANHNFTTTITNRYVDSISYEHFVGTVTNNNSFTCSFVKQVFTFRDGTGKVVDTDFTYASTDSNSSLPPGQTGSFEEIRSSSDPAFATVEVMGQSSTAPAVPIPTPTPTAPSGQPPTPADLTAPFVELTSPTTAFAMSQRVALSWAAADAGSGVSTVALRWSRGLATSAVMSGWVSPAGLTGLFGHSIAFTAAPGYRYCFQAQAVDKAGNVGAWSPSRCTTIPTDDRAFVASKGWARSKAAGWLAGTFTITKGKNLSLGSIKSVKVRQIGVIATQCATCGTVAVYVGKTKVGTISLYRKTTVARALVTLPRFTATRSGLVRLVSTTTGKIIQIDALALTAW